MAQQILSEKDDGMLRIVVRRKTAFTDAIENISRSQSKLLQRLSVRFIGEQAVDDGGVTRELSSEIVAQVVNSNYLDGIYYY